MIGSCAPRPIPVLYLDSVTHIMTATQLDPLLSIDQVAALLNINRNTLSAMIKEGISPPFIFVGRRRFALTSSVRRWIKSKDRHAKSSQHKRQHEYRVA
jgi:excisionase family DNA binding protein